MTLSSQKQAPAEDAPPAKHDISVVLQQKHSQANSETLELKRILEWTIITLLPLVVLYIVFGYLSDSLTIMSIMFDNCLALIAHFFVLASICSMLKSTIFKYPYGTGKLENFSSFFYGALMMPVAVFIFYSAVCRFISPPQDISFGLSQVPMFPSILRSACMIIWIIRLMRRHSPQSPILHTYYINYKVTLISDFLVLSGLMAGYVLMAMGYRSAGLALDPLFSMMFAAYMISAGISMTVNNFKFLLDLPLPEDDQLKILQVLSNEFENYESLGNIYTRMSGRKKFIEIKLSFNPDVSAVTIMDLRKRMQARFAELFDTFHFNLIVIDEGRQPG